MTRITMMRGHDWDNRDHWDDWNNMGNEDDWDYLNDQDDLQDKDE